MIISQYINPYSKWRKIASAAARRIDLFELFNGIISANVNEIGSDLRNKIDTLATDTDELDFLDLLASILCMREVTTSIGSFDIISINGRNTLPTSNREFFDSFVAIIVESLERISHPVVLARLAHLTWLLERWRRKEGLIALDSYINIIELLDCGQLHVQGEQDILSFAGSDLLKIAYEISYELEKPPSQQDQLNRITINLLTRAEQTNNVIALFRFSNIALCEKALPPEEVAHILEGFIERNQTAEKREMLEAVLQLKSLVAAARNT